MSKEIQATNHNMVKEFLSGISRDEIIDNYINLYDNFAERKNIVKQLTADDLINSNRAERFEKLSKHYKQLYLDDERILKVLSQRVAHLEQRLKIVSRETIKKY